MSTGERPFVDILQDRRYWVIHSITIPSLFIAGTIFVISGFAYKLFGTPNWIRYFSNTSSNISRNLINDRFSIEQVVDSYQNIVGYYPTETRRINGSSSNINQIQPNSRSIVWSPLLSTLLQIQLLKQDLLLYLKVTLSIKIKHYRLNRKFHGLLFTI